MNPNRRFEKALKAHESRNTSRAGQNYFTKYALLKERLANVEYAQTMVGFRGGNDHGPQHIERVLDHFDALLGERPNKFINIYELYLVAMSILYHDVGILLGRKQHADKSAWLLSLEQNDYVIDPLDKELMAVAVRLHSSTKKIDEVCQEYPQNQLVNGHNIRIRTIAALVRLSDELDEDQRRAPHSLQWKMSPPIAVPSDLEDTQLLPEESKFYWDFNQRVRGVLPDPQRKTIKIELRFRPEDPNSEAMIDRQRRNFVEASIEKILKINQERIYCNKFLPEALQYSAMDISILPIEGQQTWKDPWARTLTGTLAVDELMKDLPTPLKAAFLSSIEHHSLPTKIIGTPSSNSRVRRSPVAKAIVGLGMPSKEAWLKLLEILGMLDANNTHRMVSENTQHSSLEIAIHQGDSRHFVRCLGGRGYSISIILVNEENARLDEDEYSSITVVSLGDIEEEAKQKGLRLIEKGKKLKFLAKDQLVEELNKRLPAGIAQAINGLDGTVVEVTFYIVEQGVGLIVRERLRSEWFYVVDPHGSVLSASDPALQKVRASIPDLQRLPYQGDQNRSTNTNLDPNRNRFNDQEYRKRCLECFNDIRYDPLSAIGIRFSNTKLRDVYIPASAEVGAASDNQQMDIIGDYLDSLELGEKQKAQLEAQVREFMASNSTRETNAARTLYQDRKNIVVLGDPGSGKTCFVKNEILTYCSPPASGGSWYKSHVPVFIPLIESAAIFEKETDFRQVCAMLIEQQALPMQRHQLDQLAAEGHLAFFFDGLDEVPSIEQRVQIIEAIGTLINELAPQGNRFVITSRPAAIQLIELPEGLATLTLRGLTDADIRLLSTKILTLRLAADDAEAKLVERPLSRDEEELIDRLITDCEANPSLHRIATNPLLLTLLVMTYVTSGPFAAKRHRIYENAVRTLVSIRNREHGQQVLSESDLRYRLGYLAHTVLKRKVTDLPIRKEIIDLFSEAMRKEANGSLSASASQDEARQFLQQIAESTGLLRFHERTSSRDDDSVTFMHYSFLEYYAAVGCTVVEKLPVSVIAELAQYSRWRETVTLCAGLVSDHSDVTPLLEELARDRAPVDPVLKGNLIFAFDCALECDVPPDAAQRSLLDATRTSLTKGPGLVDPQFRQNLAEHVGRLLASTRSRRVLDMFAQGIEDTNPNVAAVFVDVAGRVGALAKFDKHVVEAYDRACSRAQRGEQALQAAIFGALARCIEFRSSQALDLLRKGLSSSHPQIKLSAAQAIEIESSLASHTWDELVLCLDDRNPLVAKTAARAILEGGLNVSVKEDNPGRMVLERCLRHWEKASRPESLSTLGAELDRTRIEEDIYSGGHEKAALSIRLLPWIEKDVGKVYRVLMNVLRDKEHHYVLTAALSSLRGSSSALAMLTVADAEYIGVLTKNTNRDVRIAAGRTLAALPKQDLTIRSLLHDYAKTSDGRDSKEFGEAMRILTFCARKTQDNALRGFIFDLLAADLTRINKNGFGDVARQNRLRRLLISCEELGRPGRPGLLGQLNALINNYKAPAPIRRYALRAFIHGSVPSKKNGDYLVDLIKSANPVLGSSVGLSIIEFVKGCRHRLEYIRETQSCLEQMRDELVRKWHRIDLSNIERIDDRSAQSIRLALKEVNSLLAAFTEFKEHKRVA